MPTAITLSGFNCRLDTDQDPEQLVCVWRGNVVADGTPVTFTAQNDTDLTPEDGLNVAMDELEYELP